MFPVAANISAAVYLLMLSAVYSTTPREEWEYLEGGERESAKLAFCILGVATLLVLVPVAYQRRAMTRMSGIIYAAVETQVVAMATNGLLAWGPNVVNVDPITHSRVFFSRWCEWIPMAGLMTFLSGAVDIPKGKGEKKKVILFSLSQSVSCIAGIAFPLCPGIVSWLVVMVFSILTPVPIFFQVHEKRAVFHASSPRGGSFLEKEIYDRKRFSYELMSLCCITWSSLVIMYFYNLIIHRNFPSGHYLRSE